MTFAYIAILALGFIVVTGAAMTTVRDHRAYRRFNERSAALRADMDRLDREVDAYLAEKADAYARLDEAIARAKRA